MSSSSCDKSSLSQSQEASEEKETLQLQSAYKSCKELISSLPSHEDCTGHVLRRYNGFYFLEEHLMRYLWCQQNFKANPTDVLMVTYPKSGTTWLKAMAFAILHRGPSPNNILTNHPLLTVHPQESIPHLEYLFSTHQVMPTREFLSALPSPRILSSHMPYYLLPPSVKDQAKIVYLCRDPKDTLVSMWHFRRNMERTPTAVFQELADEFCDGRAGTGSPWDHRMEYWKETLARPHQVLFLEYEDMLKRPEANARRLAEFIGRPFSDEEEKRGVVADIVKLCSIDFLKGLEVNKEGVFESGEWSVRKSAFFRNGKAGVWKEELSPQIADRMDKITQHYNSMMGYHGVAMEN